MKTLLQWFTILALSAGCTSAQTAANVDAGRAGRANCGPPQYCARTDRRTEPYPDKPPALGSAGSIVQDSVFGSRILRVTDGRSDPKGEGRPMFTPSSAEQNSWNKNSTMFYVTTSGGSILLYHFDPEAMKAQPAGTPSIGLGGEPQFSFQRPNLLFGISPRRLIFEQYDAQSGRSTDVNDPSKCVKLNSSDTATVIGVSADDNRFMTVLGPRQDDNYLVYVYDRGQGCRWYNTQTGEIGGQWGPKGTILAPDRFHIHNARLSKSGKFVYVTRGGGSEIGHGWAVWDIDGMNVGFCPAECGGHHVLGNSHIIGPSGNKHPLDLRIRPLTQLDHSTTLISGLEPARGFWYDSHYSWNNVDANDSAPVCFSTYRPSNPDVPGVAPLVTGPWENEIDCAETDGKASQVWRFAHTYSTARNGFWSTPRGNVSPDGRFFMFTSDWEDQLGKMPNSQKYRTDVFIVELK
jgi:hypothetical protein